MRIISGIYKGRRLNPPNNLPIRPTTDMAKEALFNILNNIIDYEETTALDLFAGIGNISFELVSRGCPEVVSVDNNIKCIDFIKKTAEQLDMPEISVIKTDAYKLIQTISKKFDLIFADPPYDNAGIAELPQMIFDNDLLNDEGLFVLEHPDDYDFSEHPNFFDHRVYSRVNFSFFQK
ncbi:RsmD family RNA methyltransferase [Bacteroidales bacterium OttesenSCG-928-K03]|nr:RsmD family RNA methyltransferase [Odoribacter sp. OttesenSCG-928-L07]MDL2243168.1 RsmD family RNA methyltransferase [Bacteroidales bacterium OttesenSCG-928-K03]